MKDCYSLDADWEGLDRQYRSHYQAYFNIFHRCGLHGDRRQRGRGHDGRQAGARVYVPDPHWRGYADPVRRVRLRGQPPGGAHCASRSLRLPKRPRPVEKVATPDCKTIADLARFLGVAEAQTAKAVFMVATRCAEGPARRASSLSSRWCAATWRSTRPSWPTPSRRARLRPATEEEIRAVGAVPGYASPVGLQGRAGGGR